MHTFRFVIDPLGCLSQITNHKFEMSVPKQRSYAITVRPSDGISDGQVSALSKWLRKKAEYYHLVTEKTGSQRHAHAGFILKDPVTRSNVLQMIMRLYPDLSNAEKSVLLGGS